jgi:protein subunit release factor A
MTDEATGAAGSQGAAALISQSDLRIESWPPRGKGGQHVGSSFGVQVTHLPTDITVIVNVDRSQFRNRNIALDAMAGALTSPHFRGAL